MEINLLRLLDVVKFMCVNQDSCGYEGANSINKATINIFVVSNWFGWEFHSVRLSCQHSSQQA